MVSTPGIGDVLDRSFEQIRELESGNAVEQCSHFCNIDVLNQSSI